RFRVLDQVVYQRVRGLNQIVTTRFVPGWPAYDEGALFGLNPAREYWLEELPRPTVQPHLAALSPGLMISGAQVTSAFAIFDLAESRPRAPGVEPTPGSGKLVL